MKILVQMEGFNFASNHIFGDFGPFWSEFTWICDYETKSPDSPVWSISFHYALTSDGYVLLGKAGQGVDPIIVAQVRRFGKDPESCIKELLGMYVTKARLWGLPYPGSFTPGGLFRRFDAAAFGFNLWKWISIRIMEAQENPPRDSGIP